MFVKIDNQKIDVFELDKWINRTRDATEDKKISPEFAMEILKKTNHYAVIKKVLKDIKTKNKTNEELLPYKEFILSCVDGRETSPNALEMLQELAEKGGFKKEFDVINKKDKIYKKGLLTVDTVKSKAEFDAIKGNNLAVYYDNDNVDLSEFYLDRVAVFYFKDKASVTVTNKKVMPKYFDVSNCYRLNFRNCDVSDVEEFKFKEGAIVTFATVKGLRDNIDFSNCKEVSLFALDLANLNNLKFRKGAHLWVNNCPVLPDSFDASNCDVVGFDGVTKMPKVLDLSNVRVVNISNCDMEGVEEIKFGKGAKVKFYNVKNLSAKMDTSMCENVEFAYEHYDEQGKLFNEAKDEKETIKTEVLDFSNCKNVDLEGADLKGVKEIKFMKGASVNLRFAKNLPKTLDFSECEIVDMFRANLKGVRDMKFGEGSIIDLCDCNLRSLKNLVFPANSNVDLSWSKNINSTLDVSLCKEVNLCRCDLRRVKDLKLLHERTWLNIAYAKNLPRYLDFTNCSYVKMVGADFRGVREIKLKTRGFCGAESKPLVFGKGKDFKGKYVYTDELDTAKKMATLINRGR